MPILQNLIQESYLNVILFLLFLWQVISHLFRSRIAQFRILFQLNIITVVFEEVGNVISVLDAVPPFNVLLFISSLLGVDTE